MEKVGVDRDFALPYQQMDDMRKKMESMQKYIEVLEDNLELRNTLPFHVERLATENKDLKAEIQKLQEAQEIAAIRSNCADTPASDLRNMINACKLRNVENIGFLPMI